MFFADVERCKASHRQHIAMIETIENRDAEEAARIMTEHIGRVEKYFVSGERRASGAI